MCGRSYQICQDPLPALPLRRPPPRPPGLLAIAGGLLIVLGLAGLAAAWASTARHVQRLEGELYAREATLHARLAEQEREIQALVAERQRRASRTASPPGRRPARGVTGGPPRRS